MNQGDQLQRVKTRTRRRLAFSCLAAALYFSFVLNWTEAGAFLTRSLPGSSITGSLLMFVALVLSFIALELLFLWLYRRERREERGGE